MADSIYTIKKDIVEICRRVYERGYVAANDGNVSAKLDDDNYVMTPTGMSKGFLQTSDLVVVDAEGNQTGGTRKPSSEAKMHLTIYKTRPDIRAIVHAHPPTATGFAVAKIPLTQCVLPEVIVSVGSVPIAEYATPGTQALGDVVSKYLKDYDALLLENHGAITAGHSVENAHFKMETMEHFAKIMFVAYQLGTVNALNQNQVEELMQLRKRLGIRSDAPVCDINCAINQNKPATDSGAEPAFEEKKTDSKIIEAVTTEVLNQLKK